VFPEGIIILCGLQIKCKGDIATGELIIEDDGMSISCCQACGEAFDTRDESV
jgi:hypothetical protein